MIQIIVKHGGSSSKKTKLLEKLRAYVKKYIPISVILISRI